MAHHEEQPTAIESVLELLSEHGLGAMAEAMQTLLNEAMKLERSEFLRAAPGERTDERTGYANGFKDKALRTRVGELALRVPQVRPLPGGEPLGFYPKSLERGLRSERALKLAIAEMYVQGVSTRRVTEITRELCGLEVTSTDVSRAAAELDAQLSAWRERPLGRCAYLVLDARYEKVRHGGSVIDCAVLVAMGVREEDGKRTLLGVSVSLSEAEVHWRAFLEGLRQRGLEVTKLITSDDHAGLRAARRAVFPNLPWQRCQFHLQQNAQAYVPNVALRPQVARDLRSVFNTAERGEADERLAKLVEKYRRPAPEARRVDGGERARGPRRLRAARAASPAPAHDERARTAQPRAASAHARRHAVPERSFAPPPRLGDGRRDQRGVGDRTDLLEPGERVRTPAQPLLQKKSCFIGRCGTHADYPRTHCSR